MQNTGAGNPVTAVTYNGVALTQSFSDVVSFQLAQSMWYLAAPDSGVNPVSVLMDAAHKTVSGSVSLENVHQSDPVCSSNSVLSASDSAGPITVAITTAQDDCMLVDFGCIATDDETPAIASGQTSRWNNGTTGAPDAGNSTARGATKLVGAAGSYDAVYNWAIVRDYGVGVAAVREVTAANGTGMSTLKYLQPILEWASGTAAYLRMDNFTGDSTGLTTGWLNNDAVPFNGTTWKAGLYSAGPFVSPDSITNTIVAAIKTVEMYVNLPGTTAFSDDRSWEVNDDVQMNLRFDRLGGGQASCRIYANGWSGTWNLDNNTWYDFGLQLDDGSDYNLYIDNVERLTLANQDSPTNTLHYVGCGLNGTNQLQFGLIDEVRFSTVIRSTFPTVD